MYYIIEKVFVQTNKDPNIWSDSKRIVAVNSELWRIKKYFRRVWVNYKNNNSFESFYVEDRCVEFYTGMTVVRFYITEHDLYEVE